MAKLVCESLDEFNLLKEAEEGKTNAGPLTGVVHAVKTAPGRVLRKARAKMVMGKYKKKIIARIEKIIPKFLPNIQKLITKTVNRISAIDTTKSDEIQKNQKEDILEDMKDAFKTLLDSIKNAMQEQLKVYAESLHNRLEREGTITGVKFYPEEKTNLLSQWRAIEEDINQVIQEKLIGIIDDPAIAKFQEIKAELEEYVHEMRGWSTYGSGYSVVKDEKSDISNLRSGSEEYTLFEEITKTGKNTYSFDIPYFIRDKSQFPIKPIENYVAFKIDNVEKKVGYAFYFKNNKGLLERSRRYSDIIPLIENGKTLADGQIILNKIDLSIK